MWIQLIPTGNHPILQFQSDEVPVSFGRSVHADVTLNDSMLSRIHCQLIEADGEFWIRDLESTNGTLVNGQTVLESILSSGDVLILGSVQYEIQLGSESATLSDAKMGTVPDADVYGQ